MTRVRLRVADRTIQVMIDRANRKAHMTPRLRRLIVTGGVISIGFGVMDITTEHVTGGIFFVGLGSLTLISVIRRWRGQQKGVTGVTSFQMLKAGGFFGICALTGIALFVLSVMGAVRDPVVLGAAGLISVGLSAYVVFGSHYRRGK
jgi:hypothetical protein